MSRRIMYELSYAFEFILFTSAMHPRREQKDEKKNKNKKYVRSTYTAYRFIMRWPDKTGNSQ